MRTNKTSLQDPTHRFNTNKHLKNTKAQNYLISLPTAGDSGTGSSITYDKRLGKWMDS